MQQIEEWKPISRYERLFEVSNQGRIRNRETGYIFKSGLVRHGYLAIHISRTDLNVNLNIAKEVALAFIGERKPGLQINHKNGIKTDNQVENLEYVTPSENLNHAVKIGTKVPNQHSFKQGIRAITKNILTKEQIRDVLQKRKDTGFGAIRLAPLVGLSVSVVITIIDKNKRKRIKAELGF